MAKHIGIIAVSAEGAALCYTTICTEGAADMGRHMHPEVTMHTLPLAQHMEFVEAGDYRGLGHLMVLSAKKLIDAGAELLICPDNTNHLGYAEAAKYVRIPWLHIAEEVADAATKSGYKKLGILGTKFLMESNVYPDRLKTRGIKHVIPEKPQREEITRIIMDELVYGRFSGEARTYAVGVIDSLRRAGCDAVVLGCTELPLLIREEDSPLPLLDSTRLLARAALRESLAGAPKARAIA